MLSQIFYHQYTTSEAERSREAEVEEVQRLTPHPTAEAAGQVFLTDSPVKCMQTCWCTVSFLSLKYLQDKFLFILSPP